MNLRMIILDKTLDGDVDFSKWLPTDGSTVPGGRILQEL